MKINVNEDFYKLLYEPKKLDKPYITIDIDEKVFIKKTKSYKFKADAKPKAFKYKHTYYGGNTKTEIGVF